MPAHFKGTDYGSKDVEPWWTDNGDTVHERVTEAFEFLDDNQKSRAELNRLHMSMYSNRLASGMSGADYMVYANGSKLKLNVCAAVTDTALAHISSNRPRIVYRTIGGRGSQRRRAKRLTNFVGGLFHQNRQYTHVSQKVFLAGAIFGTGFNKVCDWGGRIKSEWVFSNEIQVDDREAFYGEPRQMFQHKEIERSHALKLWPEKAEYLKDAQLLPSRAGGGATSMADPISIVAAWILPSDIDAGDGRWVQVCTECALEDEKWEAPRFPITPWRWKDPAIGYWGIGIVEELADIQSEINMLERRAQESLQYSGMQVWMQKGERNAKITNRPGGINYYSKSAPQTIQVGGIPPEIVNQIENLYAKAFEITGISMLAATSRKPAGLNSGAAIREYNDSQSQRFLHVGQRWEQLHVDLAEEMLQRAREIEERGGEEIRVLAAGSHEVEQLSFKDVAVPRDEYVTRAYPASLLPETPAGQIQTITEMAQANPNMAKHLSYQLDHPDLDAFYRRENASEMLLEKQLEDMVDRGIPHTPRSYQDLPMALEWANAEIMNGEREGEDEDRLDLVRAFVSAIEAELESAEAAAAPPPAPMMDAPVGPAPGMGPEMLPPAPAVGGPLQ